MGMRHFENIIQNPKLKEKLENILKTNDIQSKYKMCQVMLEYINAIYLIGTFEIKMEDYNILRIMNEYAKIDENLFEQMTVVNTIYEIADERGVKKEDVEYLLCKIDEIYGYIRNKYGEMKKME